MDIPKNILEMEASIRERQLSVDDFCDKASVARSTWTRWKSGAVVPNLATWARVQEKHRELVGESAPVIST